MWGTDKGGVKLKYKDRHFLEWDLLIAQFFAADAAKIGFIIKEAMNLPRSVRGTMSP